MSMPDEEFHLLEAVDEQFGLVDEGRREDSEEEDIIESTFTRYKQELEYDEFEAELRQCEQQQTTTGQKETQDEEKQPIPGHSSTIHSRLPSTQLTVTLRNKSSLADDNVDVDCSHLSPTTTTVSTVHRQEEFDDCDVDDDDDDDDDDEDDEERKRLRFRSASTVNSMKREQAFKNARSIPDSLEKIVLNDKSRQEILLPDRRNRRQPNLRLQQQRLPTKIHVNPHFHRTNLGAPAAAISLLNPLAVRRPLLSSYPPPPSSSGLSLAPLHSLRNSRVPINLINPPLLNQSKNGLNTFNGPKTFGLSFNYTEPIFNSPQNFVPVNNFSYQNPLHHQHNHHNPQPPPNGQQFNNRDHTNSIMIPMMSRNASITPDFGFSFNNQGSFHQMNGNQRPLINSMNPNAAPFIPLSINNRPEQFSPPPHHHQHQQHMHSSLNLQKTSAVEPSIMQQLPTSPPLQSPRQPHHHQHQQQHHHHHQHTSQYQMHQPNFNPRMRFNQETSSSMMQHRNPNDNSDYGHRPGGYFQNQRVDMGQPNSSYRSDLQTNQPNRFETSHNLQRNRSTQKERNSELPRSTLIALANEGNADYKRLPASGQEGVGPSHAQFQDNRRHDSNKPANRRVDNDGDGPNQNDNHSRPCHFGENGQAKRIRTSQEGIQSENGQVQPNSGSTCLHANQSNGSKNSQPQDNCSNSVLERELNIDEEYKRKIEEQKRKREEFLRQKEARRKQMTGPAKVIEPSTTTLSMQTDSNEINKKNPRNDGNQLPSLDHRLRPPFVQLKKKSTNFAGTNCGGIKRRLA